MIRHYLLGPVLILFLSVLYVNGNPMPGPPIFYKTNTYPAECYLPPDSGACDGNGETQLKEGKDVVEQKQEIRYYFDSVTESCYPFTFFVKNPCSQNKNRFDTLETCKNFCKLV